MPDPAPLPGAVPIPDDATLLPPPSAPAPIDGAISIPPDAQSLSAPGASPQPIPDDATAFTPEQTDTEDRFQAFLSRKRQVEQQTPLQDTGDLIGGAATGFGSLVKGLAWDLPKSAYELATSPSLTAGQKGYALTNTVGANLSNIPNLLENAGTGLVDNALRRGNVPISDEDYRKEFDALEKQDQERAATLQSGTQRLLVRPAVSSTLNPFSAEASEPQTGAPGTAPETIPADAIPITPTVAGQPAVPASARPMQEGLSPLLDPTNLIPFGVGKLARGLGAAAEGATTGAAAERAAQLAAKGPLAARTAGLFGAAAEKGATAAEFAAHLPEKIVPALGNHGVKEVVGTLLGGHHGLIGTAALDAAPAVLRSTAAVANAAQDALQTGSGVSNFFDRVATNPGITGIAKTVANAVSKSGLGDLLERVPGAVTGAVKGGVLNPLTPIQYLAANGDMQQFGQDLGSNIGFAGLGATTEGNSVAARNFNDVVTFGAKLNRETGPAAEQQLHLFNQLDYPAAVSLAQFANTRPDLKVRLVDGDALNSMHLDEDGNRILTFNVKNRGDLGSWIAAHEFSHALLMKPGARAAVMGTLLGNSELNTPGLFGRNVDGRFIPSREFQDVIDRYNGALGAKAIREPGTSGATLDRAYYETMAEEFYAEHMARLFAGRNYKGETAFSRINRGNTILGKAVDLITGRVGDDFAQYLDQKYAQGRFGSRWGADKLAAKVRGTAEGAQALSGIESLGVKLARDNETRVAEKPEYEPGAIPVQNFGINDLRRNPAAAEKLFGASEDLVFSPPDANGNVTVQQRTQAQANAARRAKGKAWFSALVSQDASKLPEGAMRVVHGTDAKGQPNITIEGRFMTPEQISAIKAANGLNKSQEALLNQLSRDATSRNGNQYELTYQTATNAKDRKKYASLAASNRRVTFRGMKITQQGNILYQFFDVDQFHKNYADAYERARQSGQPTPIAPQDLPVAVRDYLTNHDLGYGGAGNVLDPAKPPIQPPARVFSHPERNFLNELFGVHTKDAAGANDRIEDLRGRGEPLSTSTIKDFRVDRVNSLEPIPGDRLPVDYSKVKKNYSPNLTPEENDSITNQLNAPPLDLAAKFKGLQQRQLAAPTTHENQAPQNDSGPGARSQVHAAGSGGLEEASAYLRAGHRADEGAPEDPDTRFDERDRQVKRLLVYARQRGQHFDGTRFQAMKKLEEPSFEHYVYHDPASDRVFKETREAGYGGVPTLATLKSGAMVGADLADPATYLDRLRLSNEVFGDDLRVEGYREFKGHPLAYPGGKGVSVVTSQPFYKGTRPSGAEISTYLKSLGFMAKAASDGEISWYRPEDDLVINDTHGGNFVKLPSGKLAAIDVPIAKTAPGSVAKAFGDRPRGLNPAAIRAEGVRFSPSEESPLPIPKARWDEMVADFNSQKPAKPWLAGNNWYVTPYTYSADSSYATYRNVLGEEQQFRISNHEKPAGHPTDRYFRLQYVGDDGTNFRQNARNFIAKRVKEAPDLALNSDEDVQRRWNEIHSAEYSALQEKVEAANSLEERLKDRLNRAQDAFSRGIRVGNFKPFTTDGQKENAALAIENTKKEIRQAEESREARRKAAVERLIKYKTDNPLVDAVSSTR